MPTSRRGRPCRSPGTPTGPTPDYLDLVFDEFVELHGDRFFGDDRAIVTGFAKLDQLQGDGRRPSKRPHLQGTQRLLLRLRHPEGYRKAILKMKLAAKYGLPVICLIDTPGAYPGIGAEERGQAQVIAENMFEMSRLPTPIICVVIGEGGTGGALGIGVGDRVAMLEHAYYSVISPEGCAGILWKSHQYAEQAADGPEDHVARPAAAGRRRRRDRRAARRRPPRPSPDGHAGEAVPAPIAARTARQSLPDKLLAGRYEKFRRMGVFSKTRP